MPRTNGIPAYSPHKPTGQARVRIDGMDHYLGPHGSDRISDGSRDASSVRRAPWASQSSICTDPAQGGLSSVIGRE